MRVRKSGIHYRRSTLKRKKRMAALKELCRINHNIENKKLIEKLGISKTEFYRNYKEIADKLRAENKKESLFPF